ncbi:MAG TPA: hypothetical protein VL463_26740 [Kofleriaceae bacterium]|jgi:hypothetical protein|nr:hypothetical protein [Kofleriaceae bacterium]
MRALLFVTLLGACGSSVGSKLAGEACHASSECGADLVCDFSKSPPVCASMGQLPPDASGPDAKPGTPDAKPPPDAKLGTPDAKPTPDASVPDASVPDAALPDAA